jgi:hypothetical protein
MKKMVIFLLFMMFFGGFIFSQAKGIAPSHDKVSQAAELLGVPISDLQNWINSKFVSVPTDIPNITALQLNQEYQSSQLIADRNYKGKQVIITGVVSRIAEDYGGSSTGRGYCIEFRGTSIRVFFDDSDIEALYGITVGQTITILGTVIEKSVLIMMAHGKIL